MGGGGGISLELCKHSESNAARIEGPIVWELLPVLFYEKQVRLFHLYREQVKYKYERSRRRRILSVLVKQVKLCIIVFCCWLYSTLIFRCF